MYVFVKNGNKLLGVNGFSWFVLKITKNMSKNILKPIFDKKTCKNEKICKPHSKWAIFGHKDKHGPFFNIFVKMGQKCTF